MGDERGDGVGCAAPRGSRPHVEGPIRVAWCWMQGCALVLRRADASLRPPSHMEESAIYGAFFLATGAFQIAWSIGLATSLSNRLLIAGLLVNPGIVGVWVASRTVGLPLGPRPWTREAIGLADGVATWSEVFIVFLVRYGPQLVRPPRTEREVFDRDLLSLTVTVGLAILATVVGLWGGQE